MMKIRGFIGLLLAVFVAGLFFVVGPAHAAEPIKIGAILPLADSTGIDGSRSMQLAVKQINEKGGLLGRQVT
ncbi:MAG: ABC transporter substrate-binding protein, partial [Deltaproteobacteria bacterium]|nr:ABC transporter substrate-binding protein [Deltaproteobacteria bacterium]